MCELQFKLIGLVESTQRQRPSAVSMLAPTQNAFPNDRANDNDRMSVPVTLGLPSNAYVRRCALGSVVLHAVLASRHDTGVKLITERQEFCPSIPLSSYVAQLHKGHTTTPSGTRLILKHMIFAYGVGARRTRPDTESRQALALALSSSPPKEKGTSAS